MGNYDQEIIGEINQEIEEQNKQEPIIKVKVEFNTVILSDAFSMDITRLIDKAIRYYLSNGITLRVGMRLDIRWGEDADDITREFQAQCMITDIVITKDSVDIVALPI